jgi:hypothetical protein
MQIAYSTQPANQSFMEHLDGRYYAIHFDDVSSAVNYCGALVPHVVARLRSGESDGIESPAIWFSVHNQQAESLKGCDLLLTRGAVLAAIAGGLQTPLMSPVSRTGLPPGAVLVLGEDSRQAPLVPAARVAPNRVTQRSA